MKKKLLPILIALLFLTACNKTVPIEEGVYEDNIGQACSTSTECKTPMEYLIQSNCPFASACIENKCVVVCPISFHDFSEEISKSYTAQCKVGADCDCNQRGSKTIECVCLNGACLSVEKE